MSLSVFFKFLWASKFLWTLKFLFLFLYMEKIQKLGSEIIATYEKRIKIGGKENEGSFLNEKK